MRSNAADLGSVNLTSPIFDLKLLTNETCSQNYRWETLSIMHDIVVFLNEGLGL